MDSTASVFPVQQEEDIIPAEACEGIDVDADPVKSEISADLPEFSGNFDSPVELPTATDCSERPSEEQLEVQKVALDDAPNYNSTAPNLDLLSLEKEDNERLLSPEEITETIIEHVVYPKTSVPIEE